MPRPRLLHVLVPAALLTAVLVASAPAVAAAPLPPPTVVCIDVGHGGADPGAIGLDGLVEKNLTLDISERLAGLLRADGATVVLTRTTDASVSIAQRAATCIGAHAAVMLAIYINAWYTPTPEGSVVLYPYARDIPFAKAIDQAVAAFIAPYAGHDGGIVLRSNWWLTPPMPVATLEPLFITNPHDAALLAQPTIRQGLAAALRDGIESFLPAILARKNALTTATPAAQPTSGGAVGPSHSGAAAPAPPGAQRGSGSTGGAHVPAAAASSPGNPLGTVVLWLFLIGGAALTIRHRRSLVPLVLAVGALAMRPIGDAAIRRHASRRRQRAARQRAGSRIATRAVPPASGRHMRRVRGEEPVIALRGRPVDLRRGSPPAERSPLPSRLDELLPEDDRLPIYDPIGEVRGHPVDRSRYTSRR
jgi:N-acetylmuramoyl-L-alanine amidase